MVVKDMLRTLKDCPLDAKLVFYSPWFEYGYDLKEITGVTWYERSDGSSIAEVHIDAKREP